jgi:hypothetical protein
MPLRRHGICGGLTSWLTRAAVPSALNTSRPMRAPVAVTRVESRRHHGRRQTKRLRPDWSTVSKMWVCVK